MFLLVGFFFLCIPWILGFDNTRYDNVAVYWGQNSYGAVNSTDVANFQKPISFYCQDNAVDVFPVAFVNVFFGTGGVPSLNLANTCNPVDNATFPGTTLPNCSILASDIETCQANGKIVTISLGGAGGSVGFQNDSQGTAFAQTIWNLFLGGTSSIRPFGNAVLDGVDLDIEGGSSTGYAAFVNTIRSLASGSSKKYYVTAAPQCVYPDASLGGVINAVGFDAIYVQFYNNPCGLQNFGQPSNWDFGIWDNWARTVSPNPNVKIYVGSPASSTAAGTGYVGSNLNAIAVQMRQSFPSFGGVMLWDASQAYNNGRYDRAVKNALTAAGGVGFTYPACTTAYVTGSVYTAGQQVSYSGYNWAAKWWTQSTPSSNVNGDWSAVSACSGNPASSSSSTSSKTSTITSPSSSPTSGSCAGVAAWTSTQAYTSGDQVTYSSDLWTAQWWTQGDTPGGSAGVWTNDGPCGSSNAIVSAVSNTIESKPTPTSGVKGSRFFRF